jgi:hypothetical protein
VIKCRRARIGHHTASASTPARGRERRTPLAMSRHHDDYVDDENPDYPAGDEGDFAEWE